MRASLLVVLTGVLASAAPMGACSNRGSVGPASGDGSALVAEPDQAQGTPMQEIQAQLARELSVAPADVKVRVLDRPAVPGLVVFGATVDPKKLGRPASRFGVLDGKTIYLEQDAMTRVARAWGYGPTRTVSAVDVATVFGALHSAREGVEPILSAGTLDVFKSTAYPKQAAAAILPTELSVDGALAVSYCITSGARSIPFSVVTALIKPDSTVELRVQPIPKE